MRNSNTIGISLIDNNNGKISNVMVMQHITYSTVLLLILLVKVCNALHYHTITNPTIIIVS